MRKESNTTYKGKKRGGVFGVLVKLCLVAALVTTLFFTRHMWLGGNEETQQPTPRAVSTRKPVAKTPEPVETPEPVTEKPGPVETSTPVRISDIKVKGLYITGHSAGIEERMAHFIELCDTTEINALVIDVKDDRGKLTFIPESEEISGVGEKIIPDVKSTVALMKSHGIYAIARVVCFKDPVWSKQNPSLAIHNKSGAPWKDSAGNQWLNPYDTASWDYIVAVSREAARVGFDEIQFDYVRFPTDGRMKEIDYGAAAENKSKAVVISEFLAYTREKLADEDIKLSADVFGIILLNKGDTEGIGQDFELLLQNADYLCPMIYPSHYANKRQNGVGQRINGTLFEAPDTEPYNVVYNTLMPVQNRMPESGTYAGIRPYLQDFTASYLGEGYYIPYTAREVREQINAVYDAGFEEWILWNASGVYNEDTFEAES